MKIMQIVYPGLGGNSSVAFSLVEGQEKKSKIKNFFLFCGVENLLKNYKFKCHKLKIKFNFLKKKKYKINFIKILKILKKEKPDIIIIHDFNILPFFIYSFHNNVKIIFVHHTPDNTKNIIDWVAYFINSIFLDKVVLVSKRNSSDLMFKINKIFFNKKINVIENGINLKKFQK